MKKQIGKIIYLFAKHFPETDAKLNFGGKSLRGLAGKLMFDYCGDKINIDKNAIIGNHISIGDYSGIGKNSYIGDYVTIGTHVMMGPDCLIYTRNHEFGNIDAPMCFQGFQNYEPVRIENDVWIGGRVIILPGVLIGEGAILGAGSVVTKNVEPFSIVAGNPARIIGRRKSL